MDQTNEPINPQPFTTPAEARSYVLHLAAMASICGQPGVANQLLTEIQRLDQASQAASN